MALNAPSPSPLPSPPPQTKPTPAAASTDSNSSHSSSMPSAMVTSRSVRDDEERALTELDRSWSNMSLTDSPARRGSHPPSHPQQQQPNDHRLTLGATLGIGSRAHPAAAMASSPPAASSSSPDAPSDLHAGPSSRTGSATIPRTFPLLGQLFGIENQPPATQHQPQQPFSSERSSFAAPPSTAPAPALRGPALLSKHARSRGSGAPGSPISPDNAPPRKRPQRPQSLPLSRRAPNPSKSSALRPRSTCALPPPGRLHTLGSSRPPSFINASGSNQMTSSHLSTRSARPDRPIVAQPPSAPTFAPPTIAMHPPPPNSSPSNAEQPRGMQASSPLAMQIDSPPPAASKVTVTEPEAATNPITTESNTSEVDNSTDVGNVSSELGAFFFQPNSPDNSIEMPSSSSSFTSSFGGAGFALNNNLLPPQTQQQAPGNRNRAPLLSDTQPSPTGPQPSHSFSSSDSESAFPNVAPPEIRFRAPPSLRDALAIPHRGSHRAMHTAYSPAHHLHSPLATREPRTADGPRRAPSTTTSTRAPLPSFEPPVPERTPSSGSTGMSNPARRGMLFDALVPPGGSPGGAMHGSPSFLGALAAMNGTQSNGQEGQLPSAPSMSFTASQSGMSISGSITSSRATPARRRNSWDAISPSSTMERLGGGQPSLGTINGSPAGLGPALRLDLPPRTPSADDSSPLIHSRRRLVLGGAAAAAEDEAAAAAAASSGVYQHDGSPRPSPSPGGALGGFGASEKEGKILPSHTVKDDGLVRITPDTMASLLVGEFDDKIAGYTVIDCRFPYEHSGGAVKGAVNLSSPQAVLTHLLTPDQGLHATQPLPTRQTSTSKGKKHVLVFHCEFSAKRGPTLALALRAADRAKTLDYPACHFPELYILEGGYSSFFAAHPGHCFPKAYVQMDDSRFANQCAAQLDLFRRNLSRPGLRGKQLRPAAMPTDGQQDGSPLAPQLRPRRGLHARAASSIAPLASRGAFGLAASMARPRLSPDSPGIEDSPGDSPLGGSPLQLLRPTNAPGATDASPLAPQTHRRQVAPFTARPLALSPLGAAREREREQAQVIMPVRRSSRGFAHPALEPAVDINRIGGGRTRSTRGNALVQPPLVAAGQVTLEPETTNDPMDNPHTMLGSPFQRPRRLLRTGTAPTVLR